MLTPTKNGLRWHVRVADADGTPRAEPLELVPVCLGCGYASGGGDTARGLITCHRNPVHATRSAIDFCGEFQPSAVTLVDALEPQAPPEPSPEPTAAEPTPAEVGLPPYIEAMAAELTGKAAAFITEIMAQLRARPGLENPEVLERLEAAAKRIAEGTAPALGMRELGALAAELREMAGGRA